jgi:hypothetical protein
MDRARTCHAGVNLPRRPSMSAQVSFSNQRVCRRSAVAARIAVSLPELRFPTRDRPVRRTACPRTTCRRGDHGVVALWDPPRADQAERRRSGAASGACHRVHPSNRAEPCSELRRPPASAGRSVGSDCILKPVQWAGKRRAKALLVLGNAGGRCRRLRATTLLQVQRALEEKRLGGRRLAVLHLTTRRTVKPWAAHAWSIIQSGRRAFPRIVARFCPRRTESTELLSVLKISTSSATQRPKYTPRLYPDRAIAYIALSPAEAHFLRCRETVFIFPERRAGAAWEGRGR